MHGLTARAILPSMRRPYPWFGILSLLLLTGCSAVDPFASYSGVNLISSVPLSSWTADQSSTYMIFEPVNAAAPAGGSSEVYRLEIRNLVADGDFSRSTVGSAPNGWTYSGSGTLATVDGSAAHAISGNTMHLSTANAAERVIFDLRDATWGVRDGLLENATYNLLFDYRSSASLVSEFRQAAIADDSLRTWRAWGGADGSSSSPSFDHLNAFPGTTLVGQSEVSVGSQSIACFDFGSLSPALLQTQEAYVDDFRVVRTDIPCRARLLLNREGSASLTLAPGGYTFSIYVRADPDAGSTASRFAAEAVSLGIVRKTTVSTDNVVTDGFQETFTNGSNGLDFSSWTQLSVTLDAGETDPGNTTTTYELSVAPTDDLHAANGMDCGSILVSAPSLTLVY
jgi:hypothetical protein